MSRLSDKVINQIKERKIEPKPRWQFLLKNYVIWSLFFASVLIGAVSFCVILDVFFENDWDVYRNFTANPLHEFFLSFPLLWIALLAFFLVLAYYNYKHTKIGYRYETYVILGLSIIGSLVLGSLFHFSFGMGEKVEALLTRELPFYGKLDPHCNNVDLWLQPEKGLLAGRIIRLETPDEFDLEDFEGFVWKIEKQTNALMRGSPLLIDKQRIKLIGEKRAENIFRALEIRPWRKDCSWDWE